MTESLNGRHRLQQAVATYSTEPKVKAATAAGAGAAALITPAIIDVLDRLFLDGDGPRTVPSVYVALIGGAVVAGCAWLAGYRAPHVDR